MPIPAIASKGSLLPQSRDVLPGLQADPVILHNQLDAPFALPLLGRLP